MVSSGNLIRDAVFRPRPKGELVHGERWGEHETNRKKQSNSGAQKGGRDGQSRV